MKKLKNNFITCLGSFTSKILMMYFDINVNFQFKSNK